MIRPPYGWRFARQVAGEGSSGGTPAEYALDTTFEGLVREFMQNSNDEGPIGDGPVEVIIHAQEFTGADREEFLKTLGWEAGDTDGEGLGDHIQQVADEDEATARFLENMEDEDRLVVLTVEDRNTRGLLGDKQAGKNFAALALDELRNEKRDGSPGGGSYGLGKFTYPAWSGLSTVLFSSTLSEPDPRDDDPRLFGHAYFPTHGEESEDYEFEGDGYFGHLPTVGGATVTPTLTNPVYKWGGPKNGQPESLWGDDAQAILDNLGLPRSPDEPGTSVSILGVSPPGRPEQRDSEELGDDVATAVSKWFWPALSVGNLETTVETPTRTIEVEPDHCEAVRPFVDAFKRRHSADEALEHPGDVAILHPEVEIPDKADGTSTRDGPISVCARLADPTIDGPESELRDTVALIRGAGMVVKYYDQKSVVYGDRHFHGIVLAGRARAWGNGTPTDADVDIDDYLKAAEPPSHDDWRSNSATRNQAENYGSGYVARVADLKKTVSSTLRNLVGSVSGGGEHVAPELADRLGLTGRGKPPGGQRAIRAMDEQLEYDRSNREWTFSCRVTPAVDDHYEWSVDVQLDRLAQTGRSAGSIEITSLDCPEEGSGVTKTETSDGYHLDVDEGVDEITFSGVSAEDRTAGETRLDVTGTVEIDGGEN